MIPVLVLAFYLLPMDVRYLAAAFVFSIASLTDWLDGYLARSMGQTTPFGAFLDPVADKLLVAVALILLVEVHASALLAIPALVIVGREIVVSALREWMSQYSDLGGVKVSMIAKVKTGFQMTAIIVLLSQPPSLDNLRERWSLAEPRSPAESIDPSSKSCADSSSSRRWHARVHSGESCCLSFLLFR